MTNSATWFAREAGLFERHGLNAELIYVNSAPAVQALTAGAAPLATMSDGLGGWALSQRLGLGHAGRLVQLNSYQLITRPEIRRPENLRGKVIGIGRYGAAADWALRLILRKLGINEHKDVQIIQAGGGGPATRLGAMEAKGSMPPSPIHRKPCRRAAWDSAPWLTASNWVFPFYRGD